MEMIYKIKNLIKRYQCKKLMKKAVEILTVSLSDPETITITQIDKGTWFSEFLVDDNKDDTVRVRIGIAVPDSGKGIVIRSIYLHNYDFDAIPYISRYNSFIETFTLKQYRENKYTTLADILEFLMDTINLEWLRIMIALDRELEGAKNDKSAEEVQNV